MVISPKRDYLETGHAYSVFSQPENTNRVWMPNQNNDFNLLDFDQHMSSSVGSNVGELSPHLVAGKFGFTIPSYHYITEIRVHIYIRQNGSSGTISTDYNLYNVGLGIPTGTYPNNVDLVYPPSFTPLSIEQDSGTDFNSFPSHHIIHRSGEPFFDGLRLTPAKVNSESFVSSIVVRKLSAGEDSACEVHKMYITVYHTDERPPAFNYGDDNSLIMMGTV